MINETLSLGGRPVIGFGLGPTDPSSEKPRHLSPLLTFPAGGAVVGGLIGYAVTRNSHGATVGALVGAAAPFALTAVIIASGWKP